MEKLTIALAQLAPGESAAENLQRGLAACREAAAQGADLLLLPEMWSCGYRIYGRPAAAWQAEALAPDGVWLRAFSQAAGELGLAVGATLLERQDGAMPRNTLVLFDRFGCERLRYAKTHTCDFDAERHLTRGEELPVCTLDTAAGPVQVGAMICFDREFPEPARILMLRGAELILTPNACPMEVNRLSQLRARAFENMLAIATCNYPAGVPDCNGGSSLFDGVAWPPEGEGEHEMCRLLAGPEPGLYLAQLDLGLLRRYRAREVHGNAHRRPGLYAALTDPRVAPPFVRKDARR